MKTNAHISSKEVASKKASENELVIEMKHIKKAFGNMRVLKDINLEIKKGENLVILGESGSGKSVLIKCLVKLMESDSGEMRILNQNVAELNEELLNELRKKIGFVFQSAALYDSMTVRENLEFPCRNHSNIETIAEMDKRVREVLENVGLLEAIDKMPSELSGGMKKRIGLARALMLRPEIMLYDEPTTGLDPITTREISDLIINTQKKYHTTSIVITHDIECARIISDRIVMLNDGEFIAEGTYKELQNSSDKWVHSFFE